MTETRLTPAVAGREVADLLHAVVADVGRALSLWSVDLWTFSSDTDTLECRAYWCSDAAAARRSDCTGAVVTLDQSHDLRRLVLVAEVVERHAGDDLTPADAAALAQAGYTLRIDIPLSAGAEVLGVLSLADTTEGVGSRPRSTPASTRSRGSPPRCCEPSVLPRRTPDGATP